jgi:hypothetical protein
MLAPATVHASSLQVNTKPETPCGLVAYYKETNIFTNTYYTSNKKKIKGK